MHFHEVLYEAPGTYGFFRPADEKEILCNGGYNKEHADYIQDDPTAFGLTPDEVQAAINGQSPSDPHATPKMQEMARLLALVMRKGWVRVNYYRGAWNFQGDNLQTVRQALAYYYADDGMQEAVIEWGSDAVHPDGSASLYPEDEIRYFVKSGKFKS
jgi:hypothetical protein